MGNIELVLNQYSIAGYRGKWDYDKHLKEKSKQIIQNLIQNHKTLESKVTIPFASLVYFSDTDNRYINKYANKITDVKKEFDNKNLNMHILYPGDDYIVGTNYNSEPAISKYKQDYLNIDNLDYREPKIVSLESIKEHFYKSHLGKYFFN